jgi:hypothetical protein
MQIGLVACTAAAKVVFGHDLAATRDDDALKVAEAGSCSDGIANRVGERSLLSRVHEMLCGFILPGSKVPLHSRTSGAANQFAAA